MAQHVLEPGRCWPSLKKTSTERGKKQDGAGKTSELDRFYLEETGELPQAQAGKPQDQTCPCSSVTGGLHSLVFVETSLFL